MTVIRTGLYSQKAFDVMRAVVDSYSDIVGINGIDDIHMSRLFDISRARQDDNNEVVITPHTDTAEYRFSDALSSIGMTNTEIVHAVAKSMKTYAMKHLQAGENSTSLCIYDEQHREFVESTVNLDCMACTAFLLLGEEMPPRISDELAEEIAGEALDPVTVECIASLRNELDNCRRKLDRDLQEEAYRHAIATESLRVDASKETERIMRLIDGFRNGKVDKA